MSERCPQDRKPADLIRSPLRRVRMVPGTFPARHPLSPPGDIGFCFCSQIIAPNIESQTVECLKSGYDRDHLFWRNAGSLVARDFAAGDFAFQNELDAALFVGGVVGWTFAEYLVHRFVLHGLANPTWAASCQPGRGGPHNLLADMGLFRADLFDRRRRFRCWRAHRIRMVSFCASSRTSRYKYIVVTSA